MITDDSNLSRVFEKLSDEIYDEAFKQLLEENKGITIFKEGDYVLDAQGNRYIIYSIGFESCKVLPINNRDLIKIDINLILLELDVLARINTLFLVFLSSDERLEGFLK